MCRDGAGTLREAVTSYHYLEGTDWFVGACRGMASAGSAEKVRTAMVAVEIYLNRRI